MTLPPKLSRCFVIAEAGTAHLGQLDKAMRLVRAAAEAGADAIKFQWFHCDTVDIAFGQPTIQESMFCWIDGDEAREPRWRRSVMELDQWRQVKEYAEACGLVFLASAFQHDTVRWLIDLKLQATKVASRAAKTFPYDMDGLPQPFLVSDGMGRGLPHVPGEYIYVECEANYPSTEAWSGRGSGFSDHSGKPFLGIDAITRGCELLEVHFMVDPTDAGPDLPACLTVDELRLICDARDYYAERAA